MNCKMLLVTILGFCSVNSLAANSISIHISEKGMTTTATNMPREYIYVSKNNLRALDPKTRKDAEILAKSIEFEVYSIGENTQFHTVFQSGGGVCYAYTTKGVGVTDSSTYYKDSTKQEYYANIADGTVNSKGNVKDIQYASVFNINSPQESLRLKEQDVKYGKALAERNLKERTGTYLHNVCMFTNKENK